MIDTRADSERIKSRSGGGVMGFLKGVDKKTAVIIAALATVIILFLTKLEKNYALIPVGALGLYFLLTHKGKTPEPLCNEEARMMIIEQLENMMFKKIIPEGMYTLQIEGVPIPNIYEAKEWHFGIKYKPQYGGITTFSVSCDAYTGKMGGIVRRPAGFYGTEVKPKKTIPVEIEYEEEAPELK